MEKRRGRAHDRGRGRRREGVVILESGVGFVVRGGSGEKSVRMTWGHFGCCLLLL
jgi:hypothetical protein